MCTTSNAHLPIRIGVGSVFSVAFGTLSNHLVVFNTVGLRANLSGAQQNEVGAHLRNKDEVVAFEV